MLYDVIKLKSLINEGDANKIKEFISCNNLIIKNGKIYPNDTKEASRQVGLYYIKQYSTKIRLNASYGAILNEHCRFHDKRICQSTTLSGRVIAKHMNAFINELLAGEYDHTGAAIIYGDTDSAQFSVWPIIKSQVENGQIEWSKEKCTELYDNVAEQINLSFPDFCNKAFNMPKERGKLIRCSREITGTTGLFIKKKRYGIMIYDKEGVRYDVQGKPGKLKAMGLDSRRADTPVTVQKFLIELLIDILCEATKEQVIEKILKFKKSFEQLKPWEKGTPKRVNNLTNYKEKKERLGKTMVPGHVQASINWNQLREMNSDKHAIKIVDGHKVWVCKLKNNPMGYSAVALPVDELHIPKWFLELPFDDAEMEAKNVDKKIENLIGILDWKVQEHTVIKNNFGDLFSIE